jgi:deoxyribonuclease IV
MPLLVAHLSIAGGFHKAAESAAALGMDTVQIFTGSPRSFPRAKTSSGPRTSPSGNGSRQNGQAVSDKDAARFREAVARAGIRVPCGHDGYLINLASPDDGLWQKSLDAFVIELERAEALGLVGLVMHPGSYVDSSEEAGLDRVVRAIDLALERTDGAAVEIWIEATAGQGTNLGHRFEHLAYILAEAADSRRLGVCIDSCHIFAAGYPIGTAAEYRATMDELDRVVGLDRVRAFHLNDSKRELGSRVDRHEHIGEGCLGLGPFRRILNDPRFADLPMYLETPKGRRDDEDLDAINLRTLRGLLKKRRRARQEGF